MFRSRPAAPAARLLFTLCTLGLLLAAAPAALAADPVDAEPDFTDARLLRMPDIHGDTIVFVYAGDLWTVPRTGGPARRLTSSVGYLSQPEVQPRRPDHRLHGQLRRRRGRVHRPRRRRRADAPDLAPGLRPGDRLAAGRQVGPLPVPAREPHRAATCSCTRWPPPADCPRASCCPRRACRAGRPTGRSWPTTASPARTAPGSATRAAWPRTCGSTTSSANKSRRLTDWVGTDNFPMWHGDTIYFTSDRTGRLQIWAADLKTGEQRQVTHHDEYDVKYPSLGPDAIVYENGGWLYVLDLATEKTQKITVSLHSDNTAARPALRSVADLVGGGALAPDAKRAVFEARGDLFTVPAEKGDVRNLTATPGIRERDPVWSPDGRWVAYLSDALGRLPGVPARRRRLGRAEAADEGRDRLAVRRGLVPRQQAPADERRGHEPVAGGRRFRQAEEDRPGRSGRHPRLRLERRLGLGGLRQERGQQLPLHLPVRGGERQDAPRHQRLHRRQRALLRQRRQVPVLRLGAPLQPDPGRLRPEAHLGRHGRALPGDPAPGRAQSVPARERRGRGQVRRPGQGRRQEGQEEGRRRQGRQERQEGRSQGAPEGRLRRPGRRAWWPWTWQPGNYFDRASPTASSST